MTLVIFLLVIGAARLLLGDTPAFYIVCMVFPALLLALMLYVAFKK